MAEHVAAAHATHHDAHLTHIHTLLTELMAQVRAEGDKTKNPKEQALFETTAEVLGGLAKAYADFEGGGEKAWQ